MTLSSDEETDEQRDATGEPVGQRGLQPDTRLAQIARDIVCAFLARPDSKATTVRDLEELIEATYSVLLKMETKHSVQSEGDAHEKSRKLQFRSASEGDIESHTAAEAPLALTRAPDAGANWDGDHHLFHDGTSEPVHGTRRLPNPPKIAVRSAAKDIAWDPEAWLAKFSNPSPTMVAEARSDNPNNKRGWIGVYDDRIVCLLTGRELKILGAHLGRLFKNDPLHSAFATHAGYVEGLYLPADYPKAAPYLSSIRTKVASDRGRQKSGRPAEVQKRIDEVLAGANFDLGQRTKPLTRPGNFPDFVVCFECGKAMHDIRPHLLEVHGVSYDRYKRQWYISGRAPATGDKGMSFARTRQEAAKQLEILGISPSEQIKPDLWPGVLADKILCLNDGKLVANLKEHLDSTGQPSLAHYRARYELPDDYPAVRP